MVLELLFTFNDSGAAFITDEDHVITTDNVLTNDSDPDASNILSVSALNVGGAIGRVTDSGDGIFTHNLNGQFENLIDGETTADAFSCTL